MPDKKITDLTAATQGNATDLFEKVNDPLGVPANQQINLSQIRTFITGGLASINFVSGVSGVLLGNINTINNNTGNFISSSQTGQFYPRIGNPSGFATGQVIRPSDTGQFYPTSNPSGFITGGLSAIRVTGSNVITGGNLTGVGGTNIYLSGNFICISGGGSSSQSTGSYYPLNSNPSGYQSLLPTIIGNLSPIIINWSGANTFQYNITGNTTFGFTGQRDGQTIIVAVKSTGNFSLTWPGTGTLKWPYNNPPLQSYGSPITPVSDVYTFINVINFSYGYVVQGF